MYRMTSEDLEPDEDLLQKIALIEEKMRSICDLIPISTWGFSADVHEKLRQRKHRIVNQHLTNKEKRMLPNSKKQQVARTAGGVCRCVSEVFDLLSVNSEKDSAPKKVVLPNMVLKKVESNKEKKKGQETSESSVKADPSSDSDIEGECDQPQSTLQKIFEESDKPGYHSSVNNDENFGIGSSGSTIARGNDEVSKKEGEKRLGDQLTGVQPKKKKFVSIEVGCETEYDSLDILKQREVAMRKLQEKLKAMKAIRKGKSNATKDPSIASKLEEKRKLKRRISKMKMKQRRAKERQPNADIRKDTKMMETKQSEHETVAYSKFDFIVKQDSKKKRLTTSEKKQKFTGKDYKSLIKKVEKREEKLEKLREKEPEEAIEVEDNIRWNRVLNKAQGVKVKDNMQLLQKGLKRKEKLKEKKKENWSNREAALMREKEKKQKRRKDNIQKRIDDKKRRKMKMLKKKGRIL